MRPIFTIAFLFVSHLLIAQCNPPVSINPIPALCNGDQSYQLSAVPAGGVWSGNQISTGGLVNVGALSFTQSATYIYSDSTCTDTVTVSFFVNRAPSVNAGTDFTIVCGNINHLNGSFTQGANNTAVWSTNDGSIVGSVFDMNTPIDAPGTYLLTATDNATGCARQDTVVCYPFLPSFPNTQITDTICLGDTLLGYTQSGLYYDKFDTGAPCDSFRVLRLTVLRPVRDTVIATICDGETLAGYSNTGIYRDTFAAISGCDSIRVLDLTVLPGFSTIMTLSTCDPAQTGVFQVTLTAANGCDSIVTITVGLLPPSNTVITATICAGESLEGYDSSGVYTDVLVNQFGCDSIRTLELTVLPALSTQITSSTCDPGQTGIFQSVFTAINGCDSTVTTTVELLPSSNTLTTATICAGESLEGYDSSGVYSDVLVNQFGCDSIRTLELTVLPAPEVLAEIFADNGIGNGSINIVPQVGLPPFLYHWSTGDTEESLDSLSSGDYTLTLTDAAGCSAVFTFFVPISVSTNTPTESLMHLAAAPNPAGPGETVSITLQAPSAGQYTVSLFDISGLLIRRFVHHHTGSASNFTLQVSDSGVFILRVQDMGGRVVWLRLMVAP